MYVHTHRHIHVCICMLSHSVVSDSLQPRRLYLPGSSVHGISQARILEWVAISYSRESSWPRDCPWISCVSCIDRWILSLCHVGSPPPPHIVEVQLIYNVVLVSSVQQSDLVICERSELKWQLLSHVRLFANPWTIQSMEFSRPEYWSG